VYRTDALIAADGLWSLARRTLFSDDQVHTPKYVAYRGTIPISEVAMYARPDDLLIWAGPEMHLVQYPVRGGKLYNQVAVFKSDRYRSDSDDWGTTEELDRHFSAACPYVLEAVKQVGRGRRWPLFDRNPIIQWARNRVVLFGDAAHPMLQFLAQGACQALEDAFCIADCVEMRRPAARRLESPDFQRRDLGQANTARPTGGDCPITANEQAARVQAWQGVKRRNQ
jgi:salicylate hydroxylase